MEDEALEELDRLDRGVMYLLYSLTLTLLFIILLPYFAFKSIQTRKYFANLGERLGNLPPHLHSDGRPTLWIHAVSVGEAIAAIPLINALHARLTGYRIVVSTTTLTGQAVARSRIAAADAFCYFPFDWAFSVRRALSTIKPAIVVLMESELWPNFMRLCGEDSIPVLVANGRISDRSFRRASKFGFVTRRLYQGVARFAMQSEADADRARALGAASERVFVCGNLKYDVKPGSSSDTGLEEILTRDQRPLIIAASTLAGEEEIVISSFLKVRETPALAKTRLLIAPRHPERFRSVEHLLAGTGLSCLRRSDLNENPAQPVPDPDIVLLDSMGELSGMFRFGSVVFVGGSLVPRGGHNILEPAAVARPIVVGPHMDNFREITSDFLKRKALVQINGAGVDPSTSLTEALLKILQNADFATELGLNAEAAVRSQVGAVDCVANHVESLLTSMTNR